jgi:hypothetical protein
MIQNCGCDVSITIALIVIGYEIVDKEKIFMGSVFYIFLV